MDSPLGYLSATRHPRPCLLFVLPLLACYELGVSLLGGPNPETVRNGADNWLRIGLTRMGLTSAWVPPVFLVLVLMLWAIRRSRSCSPPREIIGVISGIALESVAFALGLWGISRGLAPFLERLGIELTLPPASEQGVRQVITYVGAGIYEETLFRLLLFSGLYALCQQLDLGSLLSLTLAGAGSALVFSAAHHLGPYGQPYSNYLFLFRVVAGIYFALLYRLRGYGIAVGAHACYNVMVSVGIS